MSDSQRLWIAAAILVMLIVASAAVAFGQGADDKIVQRDGAVKSDSSGWQWLQMLGALAIVVGLIFGTRYVLRRIGRLPAAGAGGGVFRVLAAKNISARHQIVLVGMGRRMLVVGCGPEGMATLGEVTDQDEIEELLEKLQTSPKSAGIVEKIGKKEKGESEESAE